jgi:hypothetical protein
VTPNGCAEHGPGRWSRSRWCHRQESWTRRTPRPPGPGEGREVIETPIPRHGPTEVLARINHHRLLPWYWAAEMERRKSGGMSAATIARLKITLDDVKPTVLRRIEVPFDIGLDRLHLTIQAAMGWTNSHLYEIRVGDVGWSTPPPDADWADDFLDARKARLADVLAEIGTTTLRYLYDFGEGWEHTIKVECRADPEPGVRRRTRRDRPDDAATGPH